MDGPIYVYYQLDNFYQNHRWYVKSRSVKQLAGQDLDYDDVKSDCDPVVTNEEMGKKFSLNGTPLDQDAPANPCGLVALSIFNDKYEMKDEDGTPITIDSSEIAWETDVKNKYDRPPNADSI